MSNLAFSITYQFVSRDCVHRTVQHSLGPWTRGAAVVAHEVVLIVPESALSVPQLAAVRTGNVRDIVLRELAALEGVFRVPSVRPHITDIAETNGGMFNTRQGIIMPYGKRALIICCPSTLVTAISAAATLHRQAHALASTTLTITHELANTLFSKDNSAHVSLLRRSLACSLGAAVAATASPTNGPWETGLGFQGSNATTDFRSAGVLGLAAVAWVMHHSPTLAGRAKLSEEQLESGMSFPLATAVIAVAGALIHDLARENWPQRVLAAEAAARLLVAAGSLEEAEEAGEVAGGVDTRVLGLPKLENDDGWCESVQIELESCSEPVDLVEEESEGESEDQIAACLTGSESYKESTDDSESTICSNSDDSEPSEDHNLPSKATTHSLHGLRALALDANVSDEYSHEVTIAARELTARLNSLWADAPEASLESEITEYELAAELARVAFRAPGYLLPLTTPLTPASRTCPLSMFCDLVTAVLTVIARRWDREGMSYMQFDGVMKNVFKRIGRIVADFDKSAISPTIEAVFGTLSQMHEHGHCFIYR